MKILLQSFALFIPSVTYGATSLFDFQDLVFRIVTRLSYLFFAAAVAFFVYGVVKFIASADDSAEREKGKNFMVWAIICFVVLVSIWGLVSFILDSFGLASGGTPSWITD